MRSPGPIDALTDGRFRLGPRLGSGSYGEVFRAYDRVDRREVALKLLHQRDAASLARFKREFRAVAPLRHPHLVPLHSLHRDGDRWFFTMDLVDGFDLIPYVRPGGVVDGQRLRRVFREIALGLGALHASGHVHRDVKPSNVRLQVDGAVRVLDFGFATELEGALSEELVGTPIYMAPELLAEAGRPTPASDFYALGVMLHECLAGAPPFDGRLVEMLVRKQEEDAPPLPGPDLGLGPLVAGLLARSPEARPTLDAILEALGEPAPSVRATSSVPFVGRGSELAALEEAFAEVKRGRAASVWIEGEAGAGKSALLRRFLGGLGGEVVVLRGRCYPREALPYKGLDAAVDGLADQLRRWPDDEVAALVPSGAAPLLALFPVLGRVPRLRGARRPVGYEQAQLRVEAFAALRALLGAIARRRPLVLALDDLQWSDEEGVALLEELLRPPAPVPMLFVASRRPTTGALRPALERLREATGGRRLVLGALPRDEAAALARAWLGSTAPAAERIAEETGGNPLFVELLAQAGPGVSMAEALRRAQAELEPGARRLLSLLALAGRPLPLPVAAAAGHVERAELLAALDGLQARRLAVVDESLHPPVALTYHDRIAEAVVAELEPDALREAHHALACALAARGGDAEAVAFHFDRAGELDEALHWLERAARRAETALAWERAAVLYERAIALRRDRAEPVARLQVARGDALAHAGRSADAVAAFRPALAAARAGAIAIDETDLLRRIAEQLLRSGRMSEGVGALGQALALFGLRYPAHPAEALATLLATRARLRLRGTRFRERPEGEIAPESLQRIDLCWSAGVGLSFVDSLRGAGFLARSLLDALDAGDPYRIARSLAYEAAFQANQGRRGERSARATLARATELAERIGDPHLRALIPGARCLIEFHNGRWRGALARADEAAGRFVEDAVGMAKEVVTVQLLGAAALVFLGDYDALRDRIPRVIRLAERRGDLFALTSFRSGFTNALWLADDDPERARREAVEGFRGWEPKEYVIQHFFDLWARTQIDLYEGDGLAAAARVDAGWARLKGSLLTRMPFLRIAAHDLAGRARLAGGAPKRVVSRHVRALRKEELTWAAPLADALEAGLLRRRGRARAAEAALARAEVGFEAAHMRAHAASVELARADGPTRARRAERALEACGIRAPARWARMWVP